MVKYTITAGHDRSKSQVYFVDGWLANHLFMARLGFFTYSTYTKYFKVKDLRHLPNPANDTLTFEAHGEIIYTLSIEEVNKHMDPGVFDV